MINNQLSPESACFEQNFKIVYINSIFSTSTFGENESMLANGHWGNYNLQHGLCKYAHFSASEQNLLMCTIVINHCPSSVHPSWTFHIFGFFSVITEQKQVLKTPYQVCVFWSERKMKMTALFSDGLRDFQFFLCNHWTKFEETKMTGTKYTTSSANFVFSRPKRKKHWCLGLWMAFNKGGTWYSGAPYKAISASCLDSYIGKSWKSVWF